MGNLFVAKKSKLTIQAKVEKVGTCFLTSMKYLFIVNIVPESKTQPTNLLLIGNLQRPYIHTSLKNLLNEHGNVTDLWINSKKTYAIATVTL